MIVRGMMEEGKSIVELVKDRELLIKYLKISLIVNEMMMRDLYEYLPPYWTVHSLDISLLLLCFPFCVF